MVDMHLLGHSKFLFKSLADKAISIQIKFTSLNIEG